MPKANEILSTRRDQAIGLFRGGHAIRSIGRILQIAPSTVSSIVRRWRLTGSTVNSKRSGRPRKVSLRGQRQLKRIVKKNRKSSLRSLTELYNEGKQRQQKVSAKTVSRNLHHLGFRSRRAAKKPLVSKANRKKRLAFYHHHKGWNLNKWSDVLFSDESKFNLYNCDGRIRVWRQSHERYLPDCTRKTVKGGGGSIMVWGCISRKSVGPLIEIQGTLDANRYISMILEPFFNKYWRSFRRSRKKATFMHDNAPCHRARKVTDWLGRKRIKTLTWPPQSPDLNPIENVWDKIFDAIRKRENQPNSLGQLKSALLEEWMNLPPDYLENLFAGLPNRLIELKKMNGNATKY